MLVWLTWAVVVFKGFLEDLMDLKVEGDLTGR